jgi:hypothetical protein
MGRRILYNTPTHVRMTNYPWTAPPIPYLLKKKTHKTLFQSTNAIQRGSVCILNKILFQST